jgi:Na+-transporting NADH:ubiquinone oxidoreductase subunit A
MNEIVINLTRGFDIKLIGEAERRYLDVAQSTLFALKPTDLHGLAPIPKLHVREGDEVRSGQPLFFDKSMPQVQFSSPVSGEIVEIRRAAKRAVTEIIILADSRMTFDEYPKTDPGSASRAKVVELMCQSGAWVLIRQRPFNVIADPQVTPRDIFVSCFDTGPLAPDVNELIQDSEDEFRAGLRVLVALTGGSVHLGVSPDSKDVFRKAEGVQIHTFSGPHPAGNVGIQIHHVSPIAKGEIVWTIKPQDVAIIGRLFRDGVFDARRTIAVTGAEVKQTGYFKTRIGTSIQPLVNGNLKQDHVRFISGNVLTGQRIASDGFMGLFDDQVTVIEEGDSPEFMGWLMPSYPRPSISRTFLSALFPDTRHRANSNEHGEERAYVVTGQYERVVPMDMYPQQLIKAIMVKDFDRMEGLGIYEVVEEDLALCEFVCTSKQPVQEILREGLEAIRVEG